MRTEKLDRCPIPRPDDKREDPIAPVIEEFASSGDQYHKVFCDVGEYEKVAQRLRKAADALGVGDHIKVHNTYVYDDQGNRGDRMVWLENLRVDG